MTRFSFVVRVAFVITLSALLGACSKESRKERALERASAAYRAGEFEKARIEYQNVLQTFPDDPIANERLALIWYDRGATIRAMAFFSRLNLQTPANQPLRLKRARLLLSLGRVAEARRETEAVLRTTNNVPEALVLLTDTIRERDDFKSADEALQKFPDKNSVWYHLALANLQKLRGDVAGARTALQRAVALDARSPEARAAMARFHATQNNPTQALADHKAAAELAPLRSPVRLGYISYLAQSGAVAEAVAVLKDMTQKAPDYLPAWRALAQIAMQERRFDEAMAQLQNVLRQDGTDVDAVILRARILLAKGDAKTAIAELTQVGTVLPGLAVEKHTLALAHLQNQDQASAITALEQTVVQFPENVDALLLLAQLNLRAGKPQPVVESMAALVNKRPDLIQAYLLLIEAAAAIDRLEPLAQSLVANIPKASNQAQFNYILGLVRLRQAKLAEARESFEAALAAAPDLIMAAAELVGLDLKDGKADAAVARAQALVARQPKLAAAHVLMSRAQAARKDWPAAQAAALAAVDLAPNDPGIYSTMAAAFLPAIDQPGALERIETFISKHLAQPMAALFGGQIYTSTKDYAKARAVYEKHLAANPSSGAVMNNLANLFADQLNELDRGLELARKARELEPTSPAIADTLGWLLYRKKDARAALPYLQEAAKALADNAEVQYHLGLASLATGDEPGALSALKIAAASRVEFAGKADAQAKLAELEKKLPAGSAPAAPGAKK
jgi:tetratricopeptide (TPR) repeat protein